MEEKGIIDSDLRIFYNGIGGRKFDITSQQPLQRYRATSSWYQIYNLSAHGFTLSKLDYYKNNNYRFSSDILTSFYKMLTENDKAAFKQVLEDAIVSNGTIYGDLPSGGDYFDSDFLDADAMEINDIQLTADNPYCVLAVVSWNHSFEKSNLNLFVHDSEQNLGLNLKPLDKVLIKLNSDNVFLVRKHVESTDSHGRPAVNEEFTGDPGPFVVGGVRGFEKTGLPSKRYTYYIDMKLAEARGEISMYDFNGEGDGPDALQVAAVDMYNKNLPDVPYHLALNNEVLNTAWHVSVKMGWGEESYWGTDEPNTGLKAAVLLMWPYRVYMKGNDKDMRFNIPAYSKYGGRVWRSRDYSWFHEASHLFERNNNSYNNLVFDRDPHPGGSERASGDGLFVDALGEESPHFKYAFDSKDRGFWNIPDVKTLLHHEVTGDTSCWGDNSFWGGAEYRLFTDNPNAPVEGVIAMRLDDKLTADELDTLISGNSIDRRVKLDFVPVPSLTSSSSPTIRPRLQSVYIYQFSHGRHMHRRIQAASGGEPVVLIRCTPQKKEGPNGKLYLNEYDLEFKGFDTGFKPDPYRNWLINREGRLYAIFTIEYDFSIREYDALVYGVFQGKNPFD